MYLMVSFWQIVKLKKIISTFFQLRNKKKIMRTIFFGNILTFK
jgi:hypothetical protein